MNGCIIIHKFLTTLFKLSLEASTFPSQKNTSKPFAPLPQKGRVFLGNRRAPLLNLSTPSPVPPTAAAIGKPSADPLLSIWHVPQEILPLRLDFLLLKKMPPGSASFFSSLKNNTIQY